MDLITSKPNHSERLLNRRARGLSLLAACLLLALSLGALLFPGRLYSNNLELEAFLINDLLNLLVGLPLLLLGLEAARRERPLGQLLWLGGLLYLIYNGLAVLVGTPLRGESLLLGLLVGSGVWALVDVGRGLTSTAVGPPASSIPLRLAGLLLLLFGLGFAGRALAALFSAALPHRTEIGVLLADLALAPAWLIGGWGLLRGRPWGVAFGLGTLMATCALFAGLLLLILLQPLFWGTPFAITDFVVVAGMGVACFGLCGWCMWAVYAGDRPQDDERRLAR